jgi:hypothetical protein
LSIYQTIREWEKHEQTCVVVVRMEKT